MTTAPIEIKDFSEKLDQKDYMKEELKLLKTELELEELNRDILYEKLTPNKCADLLTKGQKVTWNWKENLPQSSFNYVLTLQTALFYLGFGDKVASIDAFFGPKTQAWILAFQKKWNQDNAEKIRKGEIKKMREDGFPGARTTPEIIKALRNPSIVSSASIDKNKKTNKSDVAYGPYKLNEVVVKAEKMNKTDMTYWPFKLGEVVVKSKKAKKTNQNYTAYGPYKLNEVVVKAKKTDINEVAVKTEKINKTDIVDKETVEMETIIKDASEIIETKDFDRRLMNPYIVSALYYSDKFYTKKSKKDEKTSQIIRTIKEKIDTQTRNDFFNYLVIRSISIGSKEKSSPMDWKIRFQTDEQMKISHQDAIDIFQDEGNPAKSICSGIVILAESSRDPKNKLSTSTYKWGNTVIIFDPLTNECYRYAHLKDVYVKTGDLIKNGTEIWIIGHTGKKAMQAGHGKHIHLEINKILPEQTVSTDIYTLNQKLREIENEKLLAKE